MARQTRTLIVSDALGIQGTAVAKRSRQAGFHVKALTHDASSPEAHGLAQDGIDVQQINPEDMDALQDAMRGGYGLFCKMEHPNDFAREAREGKALLGAAKAAGLSHVVFSSLAGAEVCQGAPRFDAKREVEAHGRSLGLPFTVLRPAFLMDWFLSDFYPEERDSLLTISLPLPMDYPLQMVAEEDIALFAQSAFLDPENSIGKAIEIAGDEVNPLLLGVLFGRAITSQIQCVESTLEEMRAVQADWAPLFEWLQREGYRVNIEGLRRMQPELQKFEPWLRKTAAKRHVRIGTTYGETSTRDKDNTSREGEVFLPDSTQNKGVIEIKGALPADLQERRDLLAP